jgi:minor extracellular serine protease Vpr
LKRLFAALSFLALVAVVVAGGASGGGRATDGANAAPTVDTGSALVQLNGDPLSTYVKTKPAQGKKIDFASDTTKSYRAQLSALRNDFKQWLKTNAPNAKVTGEFDIALNAVAVQLNGTPLGTIASAPQVVKAQYQGLYTPQVTDPDLSLISAFTAYSGGPASGGVKPDGSRVKVAIVDTGIDVTHPCFSDAGFPATHQEGPSALTNNKVIVAKVFNNQSNRFRYTPEALQEHGTHVAGTVACDYGLTHSQTLVDGVPVTYGVNGVAPGAQLGNYNVFPGADGNARSEDILDALEAAYEDDMDVANMSLGGKSSGNQDLLAMGVDDLDRANMVVAVAAGNSGPGLFTIESPGKAERALTAGAATVGHFIATPVTAGGVTVPAASGDFKTVTSNLSATLGKVAGTTNGLSTACSALPAGSLSGKIALISRGTCTFSQKIRNAQDAGAIAAIVQNNVAGDPIAMGLGGIPNEPTIYAYMVSLTDGQALQAKDGQSTTISATKSYFVSGNDDFMAGFSRQGPTDVDVRIKPDVVAPGVNVLSSIPAAFCAAPPCWAFFQGTSMATPHLAGSAAVVLGQHPSWSAAQVRSAVVNTADQNVLKKSTSTVKETNVFIIGAGRENLTSAVNARVALDPVSVSFGAVPSGSGQTASRSVALSQLASGAYTASISASTGTGVTYSVAPSAGGFVITMTTAKGASAGIHQAKLTISNAGGEVAHAAVATWIK